MAHEDYDDFPKSDEADEGMEEQEEQDNQLLLCQAAERLEAYACALDPDYAQPFEDGDYVLNDGLYVSRGSTDLGGDLLTEMSFEVSQVREVIVSEKERPPTYGAVIASRYAVNSIVKRMNVMFEAFPLDLREYILTKPEFSAVDLADPQTQFTIGFEQSILIGSDGEYERDFGIKFYIDDDEVSVPDLSDSSMDDKPDDEDEFSAIFTAEDILALKGAGKTLADDFTGSNALDMFLQQMPEIQFAPLAVQLQMAENIVAQLVEWQTT